MPKPLRTYEAMHAHCINLQLQGTLTFGRLVNLYTHQCFSKYPHFQVEDLNKDNKYLNNSTRFNGKGNRGSSHNKGYNGQSQRQDKGKGRGWSTNDRNRGYQGQKQTSEYPARKTFTQNSSHTKGKGKWKENGKGIPFGKKAKGKGRGKGNRDSAMHVKSRNPK